jgi:hypothetical protein
MPVLVMCTVVRLGIDAVQLAHPSGKIPLRGFDEEMVVIPHEAVCVTEPVEALYHLAEDGKKPLAVAVVIKNVRPGVAARGDMIDCAGKFYA